eukprot:6643647-Prymnesium_polylepis.1
MFGPLPVVHPRWRADGALSLRPGLSDAHARGVAALLSRTDDMLITILLTYSLPINLLSLVH